MNCVEEISKQIVTFLLCLIASVRIRFLQSLCCINGSMFKFYLAPERSKGHKTPRSGLIIKIGHSASVARRDT